MSKISLTLIVLYYILLQNIKCDTYPQNGYRWNYLKQMTPTYNQHYYGGYQHLGPRDTSMSCNAYDRITRQVPMVSAFDSPSIDSIMPVNQMIEMEPLADSFPKSASVQVPNYNYQQAPMSAQPIYSDLSTMVDKRQAFPVYPNMPMMPYMGASPYTNAQMMPGMPYDYRSYSGYGMPQMNRNPLMSIMKGAYDFMSN